MTPQTDELDRLIDALNAGDASTVNNVEDPELAALMRAVHRIRHLQESDWPDQTVRHLTQELGRSGDSTNMRDAEQPIPEKSSRPVPTPRDPVRHEVPTRRHVSRELAQIAAAILVLVLVGGGLAVVFRNQGPGQPGGIGAAASPTASPSLPMMVTASGITVTVQMVDTASSATRFYVNIALPPYDPGYYESEVFGQSPADNVQVNGMNARATDLHVSENSIGSTRSTDRLWLDYPAPFPTNGMVTLVIKQL
ncbi:MAG TPA: hypothetical protein VHV31_13525, partial [Nitrolancea sp.]|nr:hypothetical protein [Nitrolancea sp.]